MIVYSSGSAQTHTCTHKLNEIETIRSIDRFLFVVIVGGDGAGSTLLILYLALRLYSLVCTISTFISFNVSKCFENCFFKVWEQCDWGERVHWHSSTTQIHIQIHIHIYVDIHINVSFGAAPLTIDNRLCMYSTDLMTTERSDIWLSDWLGWKLILFDFNCHFGPNYSVAYYLVCLKWIQNLAYRNGHNKWLRYIGKYSQKPKDMNLSITQNCTNAHNLPMHQLNKQTLINVNIECLLHFVFGKLNECAHKWNAHHHNHNHNWRGTKYLHCNKLFGSELLQ